MSALFHRTCNAHLPTAATGDGCYIIDADGKRYLDACGGAAVSCLGHSDEIVKATLREQLDKLPYAHTAFFTSEAAESCAELLIAHAPAGLAKMYPVSGGSEAVEAALKLARQYFLEIGQERRHRVIARRQSYHGNTLGALGVGGNLWRRAPFDSLMMSASHIAPCYEYRDRHAHETPFEYGQRVANQLAEELERLGPETVMAFIAEPVVGATAGAVPAVDGYFQRIREICDQYGILLILDEVMCGMGRTGTLFACESERVSPDIVTIAKGLGAGFQPVGALLCSATIHDAIAAGSGFFQHGHTYLGHPLAMAVAEAVVRRLTDNTTLPRVREVGALLKARLAETFAEHPHVGDLRGKGLFLALEIVRDRTTKEPFAPAHKLHQRIKRNAMALGLMCYPMGGTIDGQNGNHVLLAPPFILQDAQIDELVEKLERALHLSLTADVTA
jgi:adenosylmethionine-8-amino-7-oxononanoate aminotransferase